jgi:ribose transport system ATP-binding protein
MRGISKIFSAGRPALDGVDLDIWPGEVHALVGQNGSGKSTLVRILCGYHTPEPGGVLEVNGHSIALPIAPGQSRKLGLAFVHQGLGLAETLSVLDNVRVGHYRTGAGGRILWRHERVELKKALDRFNVTLPPDVLVTSLPQTTRAVIAVARAMQEIAIQQKGGLLVLDEPTAQLPREAARTLFTVMREIASRSGVGVLFVSHRIEEVREVADRITVLRDGKVVATVRKSDVSDDDLISMILGFHLEDLYPGMTEGGRECVLSVRGLKGDNVKEVTFDLHQGEVLGLTGLSGMGFEDVPYMLMGVGATEGDMVVDGQTIAAPRASPRSMAKLGVVLVPGDRQRQGAVMGLSVRENVTLPHISRFFHWFLDRPRERHFALSLLRKFDVRPPLPERSFATLSGGNQQKAIIGKWLATNPRVLIMHEPSQGVDVGARSHIFRLIRDMVDQGTAVIIASIEHEDLAHLCDRVLIFRYGHPVEQLVGKEQLSKERILERCYRPVAGQ